MNPKELWSLGPNDLVIPRRTDRTHSFPAGMKLAIDKPARVEAVKGSWVKLFRLPHRWHYTWLELRTKKNLEMNAEAAYVFRDRKAQCKHFAGKCYFDQDGECWHYGLWGDEVWVTYPEKCPL